MREEVGMQGKRMGREQREGAEGFKKSMKDAQPGGSETRAIFS